MVRERSVKNQRKVERRKKRAGGGAPLSFGGTIRK
jgi:hypothetical protein